MSDIINVLWGLAVLTVFFVFLWGVWWWERRFNPYSALHPDNCSRPGCRCRQIEAERQQRIRDEIRDAFDRAEIEMQVRRRRARR